MNNLTIFRIRAMYQEYHPYLTGNGVNRLYTKTDTENIGQERSSFLRDKNSNSNLTSNDVSHLQGKNRQKPLDKKGLALYIIKI